MKKHAVCVLLIALLASGLAFAGGAKQSSGSGTLAGQDISTL
jgi:hypothetical protein